MPMYSVPLRLAMMYTQYVAAIRECLGAAWNQ
jgi:hypothetical protein